MRSHRDTTRIVRTWLKEGATELPDRVLDEVLDRLPGTRQRRVWWPLRKLFRMNRAVAFGITAAAAVIVAMVGVGLFPSPGPGVGGHPEDRTPAASATPIALADAPDTGLAAGRYLIDDPFPVRITFDVPEGWTRCAYSPLEQGACGPELQGFTVQITENVVADPCDPSRAPLDPPVGPSVDDLVEAISGLPGFEVTNAVEIAVDGFHGKEIEVTAPVANCELATWSTADRTNGVGRGEVNLLRIVDVDGVRVMLAAAQLPGLSAERVAELRAVMESVRIAP